MRLDIRFNTAEEEFGYLKYVLENLEFYKKNNYSPVLPNIAELKKKINSEDESSMFEIFKEKEYDSRFFQQGLTYLNTKRELLEKCLIRLQTFEQLWNFKTFETYTVCLTKYGPGGSYNYKKGKITMLVDKDGTFKRSHPEHTVIHEFVHMGIQESIVDFYKLTHWEKEGLVDLFVKILFEDYFPKYKLQAIQDNRTDKYVIDTDSIERLPDTISKFVEDFPR